MYVLISSVNVILTIVFCCKTGEHMVHCGVLFMYKVSKKINGVKSKLVLSTVASNSMVAH